MVHPAQLPIDELLKECDVKRTRASGPGGQHRNKVETAIVITHRDSGVQGQASEKRSQHRNKDVAIQRLRVNLALAVRSDRSESGVSPLISSRVQSRKLVLSTEHMDYPAILAEALDHISEHEFDVAAAAKRIGISSSQLIKFLKTCPSAFDWVNRGREKQDLRRLS